MDSVAVVVPEALLNVSDISVIIASSLSLSSSSGSTVVQHASSFGLLGVSLFTKLTNKPAHTRTSESVTC